MQNRSSSTGFVKCRLIAALSFVIIIPASADGAPPGDSSKPATTSVDRGDSNEPLDDQTRMKIFRAPDGSLFLGQDETAAPTVQTLIDQLRDPSSDVKTKKSACYRLMDRTPGANAAKPDLLLAMKDPTIRVVAALGLVTIESNAGPASEAPPALGLYFPATASPLTPATQDAVRLLVAGLTDPDQGIDAGMAFKALSPHAAEIAPLLSKKIKAAGSDGNDPKMLVNVIDAVGDLGPGAAQAIPELMDALDAHDPRVRLAAIHALGHLRAARAGPTLAKLVTSDEPEIREAAVFMLVEIGGADAVAAVPQLTTILKGDIHNYAVKRAAAALGTIGPDAAASVPGLVDAISRSKNSDFIITMCEALGKMGRSADAALPVLHKLMEGRGIISRLHAAAAIYQIAGGPEREVALDYLVQTLHAEIDDSRRSTAAIILLQLHQHSAEAAKILLDKLTVPDAQERFMASAALRRVSPADLTAVSVFRDALDGQFLRRRVAAADALGRLGAAAIDARPRLDAMAESDKNPWARKIAKIASDRISEAKSKSP